MRRENVVFKLVDTCKERLLLERVPYRTWLDQTIIYGYWEDDGFHIITNVDMVVFNVKESELYHMAYQNTKRIFQPTCVNSLYLNVEECQSLGSLDAFGDTYILAAKTEGNVKLSACASAFILFSDVLEPVSSKYGDGLYLIPGEGYWIVVPKTIFPIDLCREKFIPVGFIKAVYEYSSKLDLVIPAERKQVLLERDMRKILDDYTFHYKEDFDTMGGILNRVAEMGEADNLFYFMCRPNGAYLFHMEDVLVEGSYPYAAMLGYEDDGRVQLCLVEVTAMNEEGCAMGHIYQIPSYDRRKSSVAENRNRPKYVKVVYPDFTSEVLSIRDFWKRRNRYRKVEYLLDDVRTLKMQNII